MADAAGKNESASAGGRRARFTIPRPGRLSVGMKLGFAAASATAVVLAATAFLLLRFFHGQLLGVITEASSNESDAMRIVLEEQMMSGDRHLLDRLVSDMSRGHGINWIGVLDGDGRVQVSSDPALTGRRFPRTSPECRVCHDHAPAQRLRSAAITHDPGTRDDLLRTVTPLPNLPHCQSCHDPQKRFNGILIIDRQLAPLQAALSSVRTQVLVGGAVVLVALLVSLGLAVDRLVLARLRRLRAAARTLEEGESGGRETAGNTQELGRLAREFNAISGEPGDELGALARAFNRMVGGLRHQREQLRARDEERIQLLDRLISTEEDERARIARELHDGIGQTMSALLIKVRSADTAGVAAGDRRELEKRISEAIDQIRRMAWDLRPSILDDYGLRSALARHIEEVTARTECDFIFKFVPDEGLDERLDPATELVLYRVAQEAVTNVVKHAAAHHASVLLYRRAGMAVVIVEDDGKGFDPAARPAAPGGGLGLVGMRERVTLLGGEFLIESKPGSGTMVRATLPLKG